MESPRISRLNNWVVHHLALAIGSVTGIYASLLSVIIFLPIPVFSKIIFIAVSNWIQLVALFVIQNTEMRQLREQRSKDDADREAQAHITRVVEAIQAQLETNATTVSD